MTINGNGWRVAVFLGGGLLGSIATGGMAYVQVSAVESRAAAKIDTLKTDVYEELRGHGALLREIDRRLARIEGSLAKSRR